VAKGEIVLPEDFLLRLSRLGEKTDEVICKVLEAGGEVVLGKVKSNLEAVIGRDTKHPSRRTGELVEALGVSPVKLNRDGTLNIKIGFSEPRRGGGSNAMVANILEHGKHGQPAKPFLKPARSASKKAVIETMIEVFEREVQRL